MSDILRESNIIELKSELNDKLEKEIVAFLNYREGGDFYIGVNDDGEALELDNIDGIQCAAADRIKKNIQPSTLGLLILSKRNIKVKILYTLSYQADLKSHTI